MEGKNIISKKGRGGPYEMDQIFGSISTFGYKIESRLLNHKDQCILDVKVVDLLVQNVKAWDLEKTVLLCSDVDKQGIVCTPLLRMVRVDKIACIQ